MRETILFCVKNSAFFSVTELLTLKFYTVNPGARVKRNQSICRHKKTKT